MSLEDLIVTEKRLGEGGFGSVFVCYLDKKKVAAKKLSQSESEIDSLVREASRLKRLQYGKHIAYTYGITSKEEGLYMVMEYSERGDLQNHLKRNRESVTYEHKMLFCRGILLGLLYCHSMKIFHGDIKCSNVIMGKNMEPKLTDFGLSMTVDNIEGYCKTYEGSIHWTAPELFCMEEENSFEEFKANPYPTDVYSLGATFCQVSFDGTTEFLDSDHIETDISLGLVSPISKDGFLEEIVDGCCQFERNERISLDECLTMLDTIAEAQLLVPVVNDEWPKIQQDIKANSKLELPPSFILHRPTGNLVIGPSNLSLLEWLCISDFKEAVEYMIQPYKDDQDQIEWLYGISELCKSLEVADFLRTYMQNSEPSYLVLSNLIDNHPQKFVEMLIKAGASICSYNLLKKAIDRRYNMIVQSVIDTTDSFNNKAIYDAVNFRNAEALKILFNAGADLKWKNEQIGSIPLVTAIDIENIEIVKILLKFIIDIKNKNNSTQISVKKEIQYRLLPSAALKDNREIVKLLIDAGATKDIVSSKRYLLSQELEQQGNVSMAYFIRNTISKTSNTVENNSLCAAIQKKQSEFVQKLIVDREDIDRIGLDGYAPLHWAVIVGDEEAVGILIRAGVDLDIKTSNKTQNLDSAFASDYLSEYTPLHIAISKGYLGIVKVLVESGADFSARNGLQQTIMDIAKEKKMEIEKIVRECAPINIILIRRAIKSMSLESIEIMIKNQQNNTEILSECLCIAASNGKNDLVKSLLKCGVSINKEYQGKTPLWWAIFGRNIKAMEIIINAGADINAKDQDGRIYLIQCIVQLNIEMTQFLIDKGADVNARDYYENSPIHYTEDSEIMKILIKAGANINAKNQDGETPLIHFVKILDTEMIQLLVKKGVDVNARDYYRNAPIHHTDDKKIMEILINAGADINAKSQNGEIALIHYVKNSNTEMVQLLVDKGADLNVRNDDRKAAFHYANDIEIVKILINAGADTNVKDQNGITPLIQCVHESDVEIMQFLVDKGADVNVRDKEGYAPIHYTDDNKIVKILIKAGADINEKNQDGETLLIHYVKNSNTEMVQFLVDKGADVNAKDKEGYASIYYANEREIIEILINAGADMNAKNKYSGTSLIRYVSDSNTEMVQFLIGKGADINAGDEYGHSPIYYANKREIVEILISHGADINAKDQRGETPLIRHVEESNTEVVQFLIDKGADINARDYYNNGLIYYADDSEIMKILINAGGDVNARSGHKGTPLLRHVKYSNTEMVQFLVDKGADVNARDDNGFAPIHYIKDRKIAEILINAGADVNAKNQDGETPLTQHIRELNTELMQFLIYKGAGVNTRDGDGNAPIHYAYEREIMEILINAGADINAKNQEGETPLIQYVKDSDIEMVQFLVDKGADVNVKDNYGNMPILYTNKKEIVKILINAGVDVNAKDSDVIAFLFRYADNSDTEMVQFLVDKEVDVNARDDDGKTPIYYTNKREIMEILINAGADVNVKDKSGGTPLIFHTSESNIEVLQLLVDKGADVNVRNDYGKAAFHYTYKREIIEILINAGADINAKDRDGEIPLILYVKNLNTEMVQFLIDKGADVNAKNKEGLASIHYANDKEIVKILINAGADINAKDRDGEIPLILYVRNSNTEMVQFLVDRGANANAIDKDGRTPIQYANDEEIIEILINAGADINEKNGYGEILLIHYVKNSDIEMVQFLVDKGANVNVRNDDGNTSIHYAYEREIMEILINAGADINAKGKNGEAFLIQFLRNSNTEMVQLLMDKGADINATDEDGNAPVHYVRDKETAEILISAGADINAKNKYGKTPFTESVSRSNKEMVWFLKEKVADINATDKDGNAPVHYVRDKEIAEILANADADINVKNRCGKGLFDILMKEQNINLSSNQHKRKKICELLEYLRDINKN